MRDPNPDLAWSWMGGLWLLLLLAITWAALRLGLIDDDPLEDREAPRGAEARSADREGNRR